MAEEKKRFPWWLWTGALAMLLLAAVLGVIETVGRQGTLEERWEGLSEREEIDEAELLRIIGPPSRITWPLVPPSRITWQSAQIYVWEDGPARLRAMVYPSPTRPGTRTAMIGLKFVDGGFRDHDRYSTRRLRRWAQQAYTAIHGLHR